MIQNLSRLLPPALFVLLLAALVPLYLYHPESLGRLRTDMAMPWDVVLVVGLLLLIGARYQFSQNDSEIMTFNEPRNLVTSGLFRFSRNPMYLGFTLLLLAAAFFVNTACALIAPLVFFLAANWWYIPHEERAASAAFGDDYDAYRRKVRRWI